MINSIFLSKVNNAKSTIFFAVFALVIVYLLTPVTTEKNSANNISGVDITMVKSNTPIVSLNSASTMFKPIKNWQKLSKSAFNLGNNRYGLARIELPKSEKKSPEDVIIVLIKNNVFTDATLYYQQGTTLTAMPLTSLTNDDKLLSITLPKSVIHEPLFLALSGRYLRGHILTFTPKEFSQYVKRASIKDGIYVGVIALFLLFSLLSYVIFKKSIFLKYAALLTTMSLWIAAGEGWLRSYFPATQGLAFFTANSLGLLFFIAFAYFSYDYLKLNQLASTTGRVLKYAQRILIFIWLGYCFSFNNFNPHLYQTVYGFALINCFVVLIASFIAAIRSLTKTNKENRFYIAAVGISLLCGLISGLSMTNIIAFHFGWTLIKISSLIELSLLASGLMYWYRDAMNKLVAKQVRHHSVQAELTATKQQLTKHEALLETRQTSHTLCPQIAKVFSLIDKTLYIKAAGNYSEVIYKGRKVTKQILVDTSLQAIEKSLGTDKIIRCHRSYLVNVDCNPILTRRTSADYDLAIEKQLIPVGRKYLKNIQHLFNKN